MANLNDPTRIKISIAAIAKMAKFDVSTPGKETAGLLIGEERDGVVYAEDVRLGEQKGNAVHVVVSDEELTQAAIEISERTDGKVIVGWIHTHPNLSAFLSSTDIKTQQNYQALMPNAIAIVMDPAKYSKTKNIDDLDLKVFRVENGKPKEFRYTITNSVEFALNTYVHGNYEISQGTIQQENVIYELSTPDGETIKSIRQSVDQMENKLDSNDITALNAWLDLLEAIDDGAIKEVPVEVEQLMSSLDNSIGEIKSNLSVIEQNMEFRKNLRTTFLIITTVILEIFGFAFFLF